MNVKRKKIAGDPAIFQILFSKTSIEPCFETANYRISRFSKQTFSRLFTLKRLECLTVFYDIY